jgi:hypothetical protein
MGYDSQRPALGTTYVQIIERSTLKAMKSFPALAFYLYASLLVIPAVAQTAIRIDEPTGRFGWLTHPYQPRYVPPINSSNTPRLESLIRAGNLYLSKYNAMDLS